MLISGTHRRPEEGIRAGLDGQTTSSKAAQGAGAGKASIGVYLISLPIWLYRWLISPWIGPRCRYFPSCSQYALDALRQHGAIKGGWLAVCRIGRCHPFGGQGFDPVPEWNSGNDDPSLIDRNRRNGETQLKSGIKSRASL